MKKQERAVIKENKEHEMSSYEQRLIIELILDYR